MFFYVCGEVVNTTAQLHSVKSEVRFCARSNSADGVLEICNGKKLRQWSQLKVRLNALRQAAIPQT